LKKTLERVIACFTKKNKKNKGVNHETIQPCFSVLRSDDSIVFSIAAKFVSLYISYHDYEPLQLVS